eukprot:Seg282.10 transcript_id=Seg282.10/GoldUCD/mRNA.D3Y31 product="Xyloside xylosyltransferase 1" protein_id=Seg282.10/GoldUCD/D3Y31
MRRTVLKSDEACEEKHDTSSSSRTKKAARMFSLKDLTRPKLGLAFGFCLCIFSALMIFTLSRYYKGKPERRDDVISSIEKDIQKEEEAMKDPNQLKGLNNHKEHIDIGGVVGDKTSERVDKQTDSGSKNLPRIKGGRFSDDKRNDETLTEKKKANKNIESKVQNNEKLLGQSQMKTNADNSKAITASENDDTPEKQHTKEQKNDTTKIRQTNGTKESSKDRINEKTREEFYVLLQLVNADQESKFASNFYHCTKSILKRTKLPLKFILTVDDVSKKTAEKIFFKVKSELKLGNIPQRTYFMIDDINKKVFPHTKALQEKFSSGQGGYYSHALFFIGPVLHKVLPTSIKQLVMLDTDLQFRTDIKHLFELFDKMSPGNVMALASDQQPVYRHVLWNYRNNHRGTKVGEPPPNGHTGFNSGVKLVDLEEMRRSVLYNQLLQAENITRVANKYNFKGHLGDQDFYTVVSFDFPQLFYTLPCQWNRQLCTWWKNNGYQEVFDLYHKCEPPYHVLHGNCNTPIPAE